MLKAMQSKTLQSHGWLNDELKKKIRTTFEPRYKRILNDDEISEITNNLVRYMEVFTKLRWSKNYGEQIKTV